MQAADIVLGCLGLCVLVLLCIRMHQRHSADELELQELEQRASAVKEEEVRHYRRFRDQAD